MFGLLLGCEQGLAVPPGQVVHALLQVGIGLQRVQPSGRFLPHSPSGATSWSRREADFAVFMVELYDEEQYE